MFKYHLTFFLDTCYKTLLLLPPNSPSQTQVLDKLLMANYLGPSLRLETKAIFVHFPPAKKKLGKVVKTWLF